MHPEPIKFKKVHETRTDIEAVKPKIITDLSNYAWQMHLSKEQATQTAITVPGHGQFQWDRTPVGVVGAQASFRRLLLAILYDIVGVLVHIDRNMVYHQPSDDHLQTLDNVIKSLNDNGLTSTSTVLKWGLTWPTSWYFRSPKARSIWP